MAQFTIPKFNNCGEMRYQMGYKLKNLVENNPKIITLDGDLRSSTGLHIVEHDHPDKVIKVGIAEQNLLAIAAGMSQEGFIPFTCTFDSFCRRNMDQLYVSVCYSDLNVKMIGAYAGLFSGKAGATHQSDKELSILLRIPNLKIIEPGCNLEMEQALDVAANTYGPFYLRLVRCQVGYNDIGKNYQFKLGKGVTVETTESGKTDIGLLTTGFMIKTAKIAAQKLNKMGYSVRIDHHPSLKPFDTDLLDDMIDSVKGIVTMENHCTSGGLYSLVTEHCFRERRSILISPIGTDPEDYIHTGHINDLLYNYHMTSNDVVNAAIALLK